MHNSKSSKFRSYLIYFVPLLNILQCYIILLQKSGTGQSSMSLWSFSLSSFLSLVAIALSLRRFMKILRKPYHRQNLYIVITVIFSVITFYSVLYSLLSVHVPNAFSGMDGATAFENVVNTIYFSIVTFTTVGFGDIHPTAPLSRIAVSIEIMSFFIFFVLLASNHATFVKPEETPNA